jgi:hypothetical protein
MFVRLAPGFSSSEGADKDERTGGYLVKIIGTLLATGLVLAAAGCGTSIQTSYDYDVNADFETYRSYNWIPVPELEPGSSRQAVQRNDLLDKRIKNHVNAQLQERGLTLDTNTPDLLIVYHTGVQDKVQVTDWGYRYSDHYWGWGGREVDVYNYEEGTLILDLIDAATQNLVWRGAGSVALDSESSPEKSDELIRKVVGKIMSKYPPNR